VCRGDSCGCEVADDLTLVLESAPSSRLARLFCMFSGTSGVILRTLGDGEKGDADSLPLRGGRDEFWGRSGHVVVVKAAGNECCAQLGSAARRI
jgi:hypothetical protein